MLIFGFYRVIRMHHHYHTRTLYQTNRQANLEMLNKELRDEYTVRRQVHLLWHPGGTPLAPRGYTSGTPGARNAACLLTPNLPVAITDATYSLGCEHPGLLFGSKNQGLPPQQYHYHQKPASLTNTRTLSSSHALLNAGRCG